MMPANTSVSLDRKIIICFITVIAGNVHHGGVYAGGHQRRIGHIKGQEVAGWMPAGSVMPLAANNEAFVPVMVIPPVPMVSVCDPKFWNRKGPHNGGLKVSPKSVWWAKLGALAPSTMGTLLPLTLISVELTIQEARVTSLVPVQPAPVVHDARRALYHDAGGGAATYWSARWKL